MMTSSESSTPSSYQNSKAYIVGGGIAALATAVYLIKEGGLSGKGVYIFEQDAVPGGCLDGAGSSDEGYLIRGGRMFEEHFVCTWDLFSKIPSLRDPDKTIKDDFIEFNKTFTSESHCRLLRNGKKLDVSSYGLSNKDNIDMLKLLFSSEESLGDKRIIDCFSTSFFETNYWYLWQTTFAFQKWSSAAEMRRYSIRFIHLLPGFNQLKGILRTEYNQYDSVVRPTVKWLREQGVNFVLNSQVIDVDFDMQADSKTATALYYLKDNQETRIDLTLHDYLFISNGSMVDAATVGSMTSVPELKGKQDAASWLLWQKLARKSPAFGNPAVFCDHVDLSKWQSFTVTLKNPRFFNFMQQFTGNTAGTGGLLTFTDSSWLMSVVLAQQPHFIDQPDDVWVFWGYGLYPDNEGDYVNKKMSDCTGAEIITELCHHLKISDKQHDYFDTANCIPCIMPYIDSQFMPRKPGDRPQIVAEGSTNFAFIGQFSEQPNDCVFTVEYSVRSAQTAVYSLLNLEKQACPIYEGHHDIRVLINSLNATRR